MNHSLILINPKSGSLHGQTTAAEIEAKLRQHQLAPEVHTGTNSAEINRFIRLARRRKPESVLVAGGDGTIGAVLKGLLHLPIKIGIIPIGSINNLSASLGFTGEIDDAFEIIRAGRTRHIDAVQAGREIMLEALGVGLFAEIMAKVDWDKEKKVGQLVAQSAVQAATQQAIRVTATVDGKRSHFETIWLAIANTPKLGLLTLDAKSRIDDGLCELMYCKPLTPLEVPQYAVSFLKGDHLGEEKIESLRVKRVQLSFPHGTNVHIDDQVAPRSRLDVRVLPAALEVYCP